MYLHTVVKELHDFLNPEGIPHATVRDIESAFTYSPAPHWYTVAA